MDEEVPASNGRRRQQKHAPNSFVQLGGCLKRMAIERKRSVRGTLCEFCSHLILILILVFGYMLSQVENMPEESYTTLSLEVPPPALIDSEDFSEGALDLYYQIMNGPLVVPTLDQYVTIGDAFRAVAGPFRRVLQTTGYSDSFTNLLYRGTLHFSPNTPMTHSLIDHMNRSYTSFRDFNVVVHDSEDDGVEYILDNLDDTAFALIALLQITPNKVNYKIRQNYTTLPNTNGVLNNPAIGINTDYQQYFFSGFLSLQRAVDAWVFDYVEVPQNNTLFPQHCTGAPPQAVLAPYPTFAYNQNPFYGSVGFLLGLVMVMSTLYPMSKLTKSIVEEKETKMRELMMIMGLPEWVHRASWFLFAFLLFFWITISTLFVTSISFLTRSDPVILFVYFFLFCMSEITFAFLLSVFFSNAKLAAIAGPVVLFGAILPRYIFYSSTNNEEVANKVLACFLSPTAFAFGADIIADYEYANVGVQSYNLFNERFSFGTVLIMLFVDFYIYAFLAWYLDQVLPHENGTPKHPLFIFDYRFWCSCFWDDGSDRDGAATDGAVAFDVMPEFHDAANHPTIEPIAEDQIPQAKIRVKGLGKQYPDGKVAVRNLNLSMLQGQITCLLGHNGAGKTTTLSMLTGLTKATTGDVSIFGHSLRRELRQIRRITGLCPQVNVLFPLLTVQEHLSFFGGVKGLTGADLRAAIDDVLVEVGLTEKRHTLSQALSGGMKRKLCLAMALMGDPKFVLLDEPTSGMDPYSRRSTWELLQRSKANRVILLTTHFMDEADTLADRIAIMSEGRLLCAGSSLFLKSKFGVGYLLSMSKTTPDASVPVLTTAIQSVVPGAAVHSSVAGEVIFKLPLGTSALFGRLFHLLQQEAPRLQIGSYGISITTLEQVFIMLAHHKPSADLAGSAAFPDAMGGAHGGVGDAALVSDTPMADAVVWWARAVAHAARYVSARLRGASSTSAAAAAEAAEQAKGDGDEYDEDGRPSVLDVVPGRLGGYQAVPTASAAPAIAAMPHEEGKSALGDDGDGSHASTAASDGAFVGNNPQYRPRGASLDAATTLPHEAAAGAAAATAASVAVDADAALDAKLAAAADAAVPSSTSPSSSQKLVDSGTGGIAEVSVWIQLSELYMKRVVVLRRDLKGFFFQIVFPAILIVLIMLILTVRLNISGRTIILNGNLFARYGNMKPRVLLGGRGNVADDALTTTMAQFANRRKFWVDPLLVADTTTTTTMAATMATMAAAGQPGAAYVQNSTAMSAYLLSMDTYEDKRQGAYLLRDQVALHVHIDWQWVQRAMQQFPIAGDVLARWVSAAGLMGQTYQFTISSETLMANAGALLGPDVVLPSSLTIPPTTVSMGGNQLRLPNLLPTLFASSMAAANRTQLISANATAQLLDALMTNARVFVVNNDAQLATFFNVFFPAVLANNANLTAALANSRETMAVAINSAASTVNDNANAASAAGFTLTLPAFVNLPTLNVTIPGVSLDSFVANVTVNVTQAGVVIAVVPAALSAGGANNAATAALLALFEVRTTVLWADLSSNALLPLIPVLFGDETDTTVAVPARYTLLHNTTSPHGLAALQGQLIEATYQLCMNPQQLPPGASSSASSSSETYQETQYLVKNHPLPITPEQTLFVQLILSLLASIFILVPLCYIPASFVAFLVKERVSKSKHLQLVSGVSPYLYWTAAYLWDLTLFAFLTLFVIACLYLFGQDVARVFIGNAQQTLGVTCLLLVYGAACIPLAYLYSFAFVNFSTAQIAIMVINFMTGFVLVLAYYVMVSVPYTQSAAKVLVHLFRFFPAYNVGEGLINISTNYFQQTIVDAGQSVWSWEIIGRDLVFMLVEAVGFFAAVLLSESPLLRSWEDRWLRWRGVAKFLPPGRTTPADEDVVREERFVRSVLRAKGWAAPAEAAEDEAEDAAEDLAGGAGSSAATAADDVILLIDRLVKTYPSLDARAQPKYAVRGVSLACHDNERFGLLGINGAGKTTTLSILTHEITATSGDVFIGGKPLADPHTRTMLGYCPQVDPLLELMNAYETLWFYGRIRGIDTSILHQRIESLIEQTGLRPHAHRPCGTYSGGNKRKLSLAVALIGDPKVLLLDEPSTGMDPEARRQMWNVIQQVSAHRTVLLVSHSMEEIEALCTRVGVMVSGRMQCLGAIQHLKGKFGTGYQVEVRCHVRWVAACLALCHNVLDPAHAVELPAIATATDGDGENDAAAAAVAPATVPVTVTVPKSALYEVEEEHGGYFRLHVHGDIDLALAFDALETHKAAWDIYDYNISQCSLEQVFIRFAREQEEETARPAGLRHHNDAAASDAAAAPAPLSLPLPLPLPLSVTDGAEILDDKALDLGV